MKTFIKKHRNRNQYLLIEDKYWVRNFAGIAPAVDINKLYNSNDLKTAIHNEQANALLHLPGIDSERFRFDTMVIVNDGTDLASASPLLKKLSTKPNVVIIAVNGALNRWEQGWKFSFYLINHPGPDAMAYMPSHRYMPSCIVSTRTNPDFVSRYEMRGGVVYQYSPTPENGWRNGSSTPVYFLDDYRNPICAAVNLACRWNVSRLILVSPHDLLPEERPGAQKLRDDAYIYPQQLIAHNFIDGAIFWLNRYNGCKVAHFGNGPEFVNATKINFDMTEKFLVD